MERSVVAREAKEAPRLNNLHRLAASRRKVWKDFRFCPFSEIQPVERGLGLPEGTLKRHSNSEIISGNMTSRKLC